MSRKTEPVVGRAQELELLDRLLADSCGGTANAVSNPEIAAELFLSLKTVESHMRNIFRKLAVSSRADVARAVERATRA